MAGFISIIRAETDSIWQAEAGLTLITKQFNNKVNIYFNKMLKKQEKQDGIILDGFSSDDEVKHEQIIIQQRKNTQAEAPHKEQVKFRIPPPQEIKDKAYSLHPDIATGWAPKSQLPVPIPMFYDNRRVDSIVKRFLEKKHDRMKLCYLGPRFENTFYAWYDREFEFPYSHIRSPHNMKFTNRVFCGQHWDAEDGLIFDSFFESGNLDCAFRVGEAEYDIYMRVDSNTRGHLNWFNFKVRNLQKLIKYRFNICNLQKSKSLYERGQKPYIYSARRFGKERKGWEQAGEAIKFDQKPSKSSRVVGNEFASSYKLSFDYYTEYQNDQIQIAYCVPYTYSQLLAFVAGLERKHADKQFLHLSKLCTSLGGLQIPLLVIHDHYSKEMESNLSSEEQAIPKKCIVISGRVHPGQSNGSFMMQGFLEFLCGDSPEAKLLRENFVFKVVPMLNPDGVTLGNYRTGISGKDFNRQYRNPDKTIFPEVYHFKKLVIENKCIYKQNFLMFLDFHGHSVKKNVFMYGPQFPIIQKHYYQCRVFPKILGNLTKMFRYYSCSFKVSEFKQTTARAIFLRKVQIPLSYTIQASNGSYYDHQLLKDVPFCPANWLEMGRKVGFALAQYADLVLANERFKYDKQMSKKKVKKEVKIRKNLRAKSTQSGQANQGIGALRTQNQLAILSINPHNQKVKKMFEQIKKAEEEKPSQQNEDDLLSEGSSDGEDQKDDLSSQKLNILFQIIKNKKSTVPQKFRLKFAAEEDTKDIKLYKTTSQNNQKDQQQDNILNCEVRHIDPLALNVGREQPIFRPSLKGYLLKTRSNQTAYVVSQKRREKVAAKIINFSFASHHQGRPSKFSLDSKRDGSSGRNQAIDSIAVSLFNSKSKINNKVLDLSDQSFRQTFVNNPIKQQKMLALSSKPDRKNLTFVNISPRKLVAGRLEEFKYRRLLIEEYKL